MKSEKPLQQLLEVLDSESFALLRNHFSTVLTPYPIRKGRLLVDIGQVNEFMYFIEKGVIRSYYLKGSDDITSRLVADGDIACVAESFFNQSPSNEVMEALEDTQVYSVSYDDYRLLSGKNVIISQLIIRLLEERLVNYSERVKVFKYLSVEERISYYINHPMSLFRRIPDHFIATFLGTTPATFSRCLKELNKNGVHFTN